MTRRCVGVVLVALVATLALRATRPLSGQTTIAVGAGAGTLGMGGSVFVSVAPFLTLRAGAALQGLEIDAGGRWDLPVEHTSKLTVPGGARMAGVDLELYLLRIGGGFVNWTESPVFGIEASSTAELEIGDNSYTSKDVSSLSAALEFSDFSPYLLVGFGSLTTGRRVSLFFDAGVVLLAGPSISISVVGDNLLLKTQDFRDAVDLEEERIAVQIGNLLNYWPVLTAGLRIGLGSF